MSGWLAIINPHSGTFASSNFRERWLPQLRGLVDEALFTTGPGDGTGFAAGAVGYSGIVVVGGDGSIADVLAGMDLGRQRLSVIPTGRGNTLARELGLGRIEAALRALEDGREVRLDLMRARFRLADGERLQRLGATTIGIGYTAGVVRRAAHLRALGKLAYGLASVTTRPMPFAVELASGDAEPQRYSLTGMIVNNTRFLANFLALRDASPTDGRLDLMLLRTGWLTQIVHNLSVLSGLHFYQPAELRQAAITKLAFTVPQTVMIDGDLVDQVAQLRVEALPRAVALRCRGSG